MSRRGKTAIIFDLGNVLIDVLWQRALERLRGRTPFDDDELHGRVTSSPALTAYEEGRIDTPVFTASLVELLEAEITPEEYAEIWTCIFARRPEMEEFFAEMQNERPVAILSDTSPLHWDYICELIPLFAEADYCAVSHEIGSHKPAAANYLAAANGLDVAPEECLFVDDLEKNVAGAEAVGMKALQFTSTDETINSIRRFLGKQ